MVPPNQAELLFNALKKRGFPPPISRTKENSTASDRQRTLSVLRGGASLLLQDFRNLSSGKNRTRKNRKSLALEASPVDVFRVHSHDGAAVTVEKISKSYGVIWALNGVNTTVAKGEIRGLLGANGSGKSTLMKILLGLVNRITAGSPSSEADPALQPILVRQNVGYVPETPRLYDFLDRSRVSGLCCESPLPSRGNQKAAD